MTVSNRSGKMKRNTEQTVLTFLAAIDPAFRLPFPVPVQKRNRLSDDRNWETLPQPCTKIRIARESGQHRQRPQNICEPHDGVTSPLHPRHTTAGLASSPNQYSVFKEQIQHATWVTL